MGWQERDWVGPFYPDDTAQKAMLARYSRALPTVEVDSTFYGRPRASTVEDWRAATPDGFRFALKVPREVTHRRRFKDADEPFRWFLERVKQLGPKLGAVLLQCPPDFKASPANRDRLYSFIDAQLPVDVDLALELRDPAWFDDALFACADANAFALAATESGRFDVGSARDIVARQPTSAFAYLRLMSDEQFERFDRVQLDRSASLAVWAEIVATARGRMRDVYCYVSDDYAGHAPGTLRELLERLGEAPPPALSP
jgi:uncharacterized protein YecE (DUF72 family)